MEQKETQEVTTVTHQAPEQVVRKTTLVSPPPVKTEHPQQVFEQKRAIFRTHQIIWYILTVIEVLLAFRMTLKALGANPLSGFTSFIYAASDVFALPFSGILSTSVTATSVIEWSTIVAALVYLCIAYGLVHLIQILKPVTPDEVTQSVDNAV